MHPRRNQPTCPHAHVRMQAALPWVPPTWRGCTRGVGGASMPGSHGSPPHLHMHACPTPPPPSPSPCRHATCTATSTSSSALLDRSPPILPQTSPDLPARPAHTRAPVGVGSSPGSLRAAASAPSPQTWD
eukprot:257810-Chlamydomonas_euryale.AAC.2